MVCEPNFNLQMPPSLNMPKLGCEPILLAVPFVKMALPLPAHPAIVSSVFFSPFPFFGPVVAARQPHAAMLCSIGPRFFMHLSDKNANTQDHPFVTCIP